MIVTTSKPVLTCSKTEWLTALGLASYGLGFPSVVISVGEPDEAPCGLLGAPFARTIKTAETRHERPSRLAPKHIDYNQTSRNIKFFLLLVPPLQRNGRIPSLEQKARPEIVVLPPYHAVQPKVYLLSPLLSAISLCSWKAFQIHPGSSHTCRGTIWLQKEIAFDR